MFCGTTYWSTDLLADANRLTRRSRSVRCGWAIAESIQNQKSIGRQLIKGPIRKSLEVFGQDVVQLGPKAQQWSGEECPRDFRETELEIIRKVRDLGPDAPLRVRRVPAA